MERKRKFNKDEIAKYAAQHGVAKASEKFGCSPATAYNACRAKDVRPPSYPYLKSKEVVDWMIANKATVAEATNHFKVSAASVRRYCEVLGHKPAEAEYHVPVSLSNFEILAALICGYNQSQIAREYGISSQRVQQIQARATDARLIGKRAIVEVKDNVPFDKKAGVYRP